MRIDRNQKHQFPADGLTGRGLANLQRLPLAALGRSTFVLLLLLSSLLIAVQPVAAESGMSYVVERGDTLNKIARKFDVDLADLAAVNGVKPTAWVYVGQTLTIPAAAGNPAGAAAEPLQLGPDPLVPDPMPAMALVPLAKPERVSPFVYAQVLGTVPVYGDPSDAIAGRAPKRWIGGGYVWVTVDREVTQADQDFYQINPGEYVRAGALSFYNPSRFQGVQLAAHPERPFAWILRGVQPSLEPLGDVNAQAPTYQRYDLVQIFATENVSGQVWYLIGPHQWIRQIYVGKVEASQPPAGVEPGARWIEVNLFEQTLAAYEGERMVYATLVSSGLPGWDTPTGLNRVWLRVEDRKMSGAEGRADYYFLEDVPWTQYFAGAVALHGAYWHDGFGYRHSHGCVNLALLDSQWLYNWAPDNVWVWVHY